MSNIYKVKIIVEEHHYINIEANSKEEAEDKAENLGVNSLDADSTSVDAYVMGKIAEGEADGRSNEI